MENIDDLKKIIILEQKIIYLEKELMNFNKELIEHQQKEAIELKEIKEELKKISEVVIAGKVTWKTISIFGAIILGVISVLKFGIDLFTIKP